MHTPKPHPRAVESSAACARLVQAGDLDGAETQCELGLEFAPHWGDLWVNKGLVHLGRGQRREAKEAFQRALQLNPDQAQAHNDLGLVLRAEGQRAAARESFLAALRVDPDYAEARYNLALVLQEGGERGRAREEYLKLVAVSASPSATRDFGALARHDLGAMDFADRQYARSERLFRQVVEDAAAPASLRARAHLGLGLALLAQGRAAEAGASLEHCLGEASVAAPCAEAREEVRQAGAAPAP
jgi:tetratricopeptide (TPR) repeat protein